MSFIIENGVLKKYTAEPGITRVEIPEGVTQIDNFAFSDWQEIKEIILPDSMTELKGQVLCGCNALAHIHISGGVTKIDLFRFNILRSLAEITVSENNSCFCSLDGVLYTKDMKTLVLCPLCKSSITIPESVTCIGEEALAGCFQITEIRFPSHLTAIKSYAFHGCGIREAIIPESVTKLENGAFYYCRNLSRIKLPDGITEISDSLFGYNYELNEITIPESVKIIGRNAFDYCRKLSCISLPESVSSVGSCAFSSCYSLRKIALPYQITRLEDYTFGYCLALECITFHGNITDIGERAFADCRSLASLTIPASVTNIGERAFSCCHSLASLTIPVSVTNIGERTFENCHSLSVIKLHPDDPDMIREYHSIRYLDDSIQTGLRIVQTGDTSIPLDRKIKYTFIVLHYLRTKDSRLKLYIQKNIQKIMKKCITCGDTAVIRAFAETDDFISENCIDKYIQRALDCRQQEIYDCLTEYKSRLFPKVE